MTYPGRKKSIVGTGAPLPENVETDERMCVCLCIPNEPEYRRAFIGHLAELGKWWFWEKGGRGDDRATRAAALWRKVIAEDLQMPCGGEPQFIVQDRLTESGDIERSYDGGDTWEILLPGQDPRHAGPKLAPIVGGTEDERRCAGANSIVTVLTAEQQSQYNRKQLGATAAQIVAGFVAFLVGLGIIATGGIAAVLATAIGSIFALLDADTFNDAFTPTVWRNALCSFYRNANPDGSYTVNQWKTVLSELGEIDGIAGRWLKSTVEAMGVTGLTNAARSLTGGDLTCEDCETQEGTIFRFNFLTSQYAEYWDGNRASSPTFNQWISGTGWTTAGYADWGPRLTLPSAMNVKRLAITVPNPVTQPTVIEWKYEGGATESKSYNAPTLAPAPYWHIPTGNLMGETGQLVTGFSLAHNGGSPITECWIEFWQPVSLPGVEIVEEMPFPPV